MTGRRERSNEANGLPRVISPELRRLLQERYAQAQSQMARPAYDFGNVHRLLGENLATDPGNLRYVELMLLNLQRREEAGIRPGLLHRWIGASPIGARAALERSIEAEHWPEAARLVPESLWAAGPEESVLGLAAEVCAGLELGPAELMYRKAAVAAAPAKTEPIRRLARALKRMGMYADARDWWLKLAAACPDDPEATAEIAAANAGVAGEEEDPLRDRIAADGADLNALLSLVRRRVQVSDFDEASRLLTQASAVGGGDLRVRQAWEELSLAQSEHRLRLAREAVERDNSESAQRLVAEVSEEHERLALGIAHSRAERFPGDGRLLLELGRRLKRNGNYSGAVQRFEELRHQADFEMDALVELGECWQHLRQFEKALRYYQEAIDSRRLPGDPDTRHRALYRGAVLAEALGLGRQACHWLEELVASAGGYKDAQERLDKLRPICDKNGFSAP